ncbi:MAG TPA: hypothetical protein VGJ09_01420 [Bryobacteraceae bacterium]
MQNKISFTVVLAMLLAACGKTGQPSSTVTGLTPDSAPAKAEAPLFSKPEPVTIAAGTPIKIRTDSSLSTKTAAAGDTFTAILTAPLVVDGKEVAPRGAHVQGRVASSDPGGRVKGVASISVRLTQLRVGAGDVAIATSTVARQAHATKTRDAEKVGIGAGIGAAIGAIAGGGTGAAIGAGAGGAAGTGLVLATRGEPAVIPAETILTFKLTAPVTLGAN